MDWLNIIGLFLGSALVGLGAGSKVWEVTFSVVGVIIIVYSALTHVMS